MRMNMPLQYAGPTTLGLMLVLGQLACTPRAREADATAAARTDSANVVVGKASVASPAATPPQTQPDTPPAGATKPAAQPSAGGSKVSKLEYEGWRQYSVHCARCHGQDALPNPVAANLLISLAPGGPTDTYEEFRQVVSDGRPERGMPGFKGVLTEEQIRAMYAYLKGRAEKRIPAGRPASPSA
jgi:mono/diheme cytochrome c family protein